jgi:hypothetical protein
MVIFKQQTLLLIRSIDAALWKLDFQKCICERYYNTAIAGTEIYDTPLQEK